MAGMAAEGSEEGEEGQDGAALVHWGSPSGLWDSSEVARLVEAEEKLLHAASRLELKGWSELIPWQESCFDFSAKIASRSRRD